MSRVPKTESHVSPNLGLNDGEMLVGEYASQAESKRRAVEFFRRAIQVARAGLIRDPVDLGAIAQYTGDWPHRWKSSRTMPMIPIRMKTIEIGTTGRKCLTWGSLAISNTMTFETSSY